MLLLIIQSNFPDDFFLNKNKFYAHWQPFVIVHAQRKVAKYPHVNNKQCLGKNEEQERKYIYIITSRVTTIFCLADVTVETRIITKRNLN